MGRLCNDRCGAAGDGGGQETASGAGGVHSQQAPLLSRSRAVHGTAPGPLWVRGQPLLRCVV